MPKVGGILRSAFGRANYMFANFRPGWDARHNDNRHRASSLQGHGSKVAAEGNPIRVDVVFGSCGGRGLVSYRPAASAWEIQT